MELENSVKDICFTFRSIPNRDNGRKVRYAGGFKCTNLYGILTSPIRNVISDGIEQIPADLSLDEAEDSTGEWCGVFYSSSERAWIVAADPFGYQPVYYRAIRNGAGDETLLVGSSASAIASEAAQQGVKSAVDSVQAQAILGTNHAFGITMQSNHALSEDTRVLLPREVLFVDENGWSVTKRTAAVENSSYEELIERGAQKAIWQLQAAMELPVDQRHINLSGGRDSRLVMALLSAANLAGEFSVTSMNPETWTPASSRPLLRQDLYVAAAIAEEYKMTWSKPFEYDYVPLSFEGALALWQQFRAGKNFGFKARKSYYRQLGTNIELRGAGGETFRGFKAVTSLPSYGKWGNTSSSLSQDLGLVVDDVYGAGLLNSEQKDAQRQSLRGLLEDLGETQVEDGLQHRYSIFRNRSHFGHVRESAANGQIPLLILSQPEFYQAGKLLGNRKMREDQIVFDLVEMLDSKLNALRFDDGGWPADKAAQVASRFSWQVPEDGPMLDKFFKNEERALANRQEAQARVPKMVKNLNTFEPNFRAKNEAKELLQDLQSLPNGQECLGGGVLEKLHDQIDQDSTPPTTLVAKLSSIRDAVLPRTKPSVIVFNSSQMGMLGQFRNRVAGSFNGVREVQRHPVFQVPLQVSPGQITATVRAFGTVRKPLEFAFELYSADGEFLDSSAFTESNRVTFSGIERKDRLRVRVHARYKAHALTAFTFFSAYTQPGWNGE